MWLFQDHKNYSEGNQNKTFEGNQSSLERQQVKKFRRKPKLFKGNQNKVYKGNQNEK